MPIVGSHNRSYGRISYWDALNQPNYELLAKAQVTKMELDGAKAIGIASQASAADSRLAGPTTVKSNKRTILSTGAIHSPQILHLSGIGPGKLLESANIQTKIDLPGVGKNSHDHNTLTMKIECKPPSTSTQYTHRG